MLSSMITLNKDQAVADQLFNLRVEVECIVGTEDGSFVVYQEQIADEGNLRSRLT